MSELEFEVGDMRKMAADGIRLNISSPTYTEILCPVL